MAAFGSGADFEVSNCGAMPEHTGSKSLSLVRRSLCSGDGLFSEGSAVLQDCLLLFLSKLFAGRHLARAFSDDLQ